MRRMAFLVCVLLAASTAWATKQIPNGSSSQSITVVIRDAAGAPVTGITIANLDLYCVRDGDKQSAKTDLSALASADAAWSSGKAYEIGNGLYRIDIPDANLSDGVGQMLTYIVDDAVGTNVTTFYEVQLVPPWPTFTAVGGVQMPSVNVNGWKDVEPNDLMNQTDLSAQLDAQGLTTTRAAYLDNINNADLATTKAQTGDAYAKVNDSTYGLSALKTWLSRIYNAVWRISR